jgi:hypothetical protein
MKVSVKISEAEIIEELGSEKADKFKKMTATERKDAVVEITKAVTEELDGEADISDAVESWADDNGLSEKEYTVTLKREETKTVTVRACDEDEATEKAEGEDWDSEDSTDEGSWEADEVDES